MPRQVSRRRTRRTQVNTDLTPVSASPVASPVSLGRPVAARNGFQELAGALSDFQPELEQFTEQKRKEQAEADFAAGQQARSILGELPLDEDIRKHLTANQSAEFQVGWMRMHGQRQGHHASRQLAEEYALWNDKDTGDVDQFIMDFRSRRFADLDDKDFLDGYLPVMEKTVENLRVGHLKDTLDRIEQEKDTTAFGLLKDDFDAAFEAGQPVPEFITDVHERAAELHEVIGLERSRVDDLVFEALRLAAEENLDMKYFEYFDAQRPDGTPGLSSNPKFAEKIANAKAKTQRLIDAENSEKDKLAIMGLIREGEELAEKGQLTAAYENSLLERGLSVSLVQALRNKNASFGASISDAQKHQLWEDGNELAQVGEYTELRALNDIARGLDASLVRSLRKASNAANLKATKSRAIELAIVEGRSHEFSDSEVQPVFDNMVTRTIDQLGGDITHPQAMRYVIHVGKQRGLLYSPYKRMMDNATRALSANPKLFASAHELYSQLRGSDAPYAAEYVDDNTATAFGVYDTFVAIGADDPLQSLALAIEGLPDAKAAFGGRNMGQFNQALKNAVDGGIWDFTADRIPLITRTTVRDLAIGYMAMGSLTLEEAITQSMNRYTNTHTELTDGVWVENSTIPTGWDNDAADWLLKEHVPALLKEQGVPLNDDGYWLAQSQRTKVDGTLAVYEEGSALVVDHVDLRQVFAAYKEVTGQQPMTSEEARGLQATHQQQVLEDWRFDLWSKLVVRNTTQPLSRIIEGDALDRLPIDPPGNFLPLDDVKTTELFNEFKRLDDDRQFINTHLSDFLN